MKNISNTDYTAELIRSAGTFGVFLPWRAKLLDLKSYSIACPPGLCAQFIPKRTAELLLGYGG